MQRLPSWLRHPQMLAACMIGLIACVIVLYVFVTPLMASKSSVASPMQEEALAFEEAAPSPVATLTAVPLIAPSPIVVYITGAVQAPDTYQLPPNARVKDLVVAAGGLTEDADVDQINLAAKLSDTEHIHIPRQGEASPPSSSAASSTSSAAESTSHLININTATADELESLPGIGQTLAKRIIDYRTANGPFTSVDQLKQVKGISAALIGDIAPSITVEP